jgi:hypothetical protein
MEGDVEKVMSGQFRVWLGLARFSLFRMVKHNWRYPFFVYIKIQRRIFDVKSF